MEDLLAIKSLDPYQGTEKTYLSAFVRKKRHLVALGARENLTHSIELDGKETD